MSKGKLAKFADLETNPNVFQYPYKAMEALPEFEMRGYWREQYFHNDNPIVLELGCGKGEYTMGMAKMIPDKNFIGIDIKGARMWTGATQALNEGLKNVAFLRTNIEIIDRFFAENEIESIWLTFCDPQMKNPRKRLTSTWFMERYRKFLKENGHIHLKTDSNFLFTYTKLMLEKNGIEPDAVSEDLYKGITLPHKMDDSEPAELVFPRHIQTYYEQMWIDRGISIKYLRWCLPKRGELEEPDIEIELDDYRSYHRTKRSSLKTSK